MHWIYAIFLAIFMVLVCFSILFMILAGEWNPIQGFYLFCMTCELLFGDPWSSRGKDSNSRSFRQTPLTVRHPDDMSVVKKFNPPLWAPDRIERNYLRQQWYARFTSAYIAAIPPNKKGMVPSLEEFLLAIPLPMCLSCNSQPATCHAECDHLRPMVCNRCAIKTKICPLKTCAQRQFVWSHYDFTDAVDDEELVSIKC